MNKERKSVNVDFDIWYKLTLIKLSNPKKYRTLADVIQELLDDIDDNKDNEVDR